MRPAAICLKHLCSAAFVVAALAFILPFVVPLNHYLPDIEKLASDALQEPVHIEGMRVALLPLPHVHLKEVSIGKNADVQIASCNINLNLYALFNPAKAIHNVVLRDVTLRQPALTKLPGWFQNSTLLAAPLNTIKLDNLNLLLPKLSLGPFNGSVQLTPRNDFKGAALASRDGKLKLALQPKGREYHLEVTAQQWQPLLGPKFLFDTLSANILLTDGGLHAQSIKGKLYGGQVSATADMDWDKSWRLYGVLSAHGVQVQPLLALFNLTRSMTGVLDGDATYSLRAAKAAQLLDQPQVNAEFRVQKGVIYKVDLAKAAQTLAKEGAGDGETRFDEFTGRLELADNEYRFKDLNINSGLLNGSGNVNIRPDQQLDGRVKIALKAGINLAEVPFDVTGTFVEPTLRVPPVAIAGAVAGTALLGPGLGTSLGVKAGEAAEKIKVWLSRDASQQSVPPEKQ
ncbi:MAG: AsmA family protein [Gammaproteobacteria bacterium]|nr:AsmA family protein [Gammaproteobacteria bacterium]